MLRNSFLRDDIFHPIGKLLKNQSACSRHLSWSEPSLDILDGLGTLEISVLLRVLLSSPHCSWKFEERKDLVHLVSFRVFTNLGVIYFLSFNQSSFRRSSWSNTASSSQSGKTQEIQRPWRKFVAGMNWWVLAFMWDTTEMCVPAFADGHKVDQILWSSQESPQQSQHGKINGDYGLVKIKFLSPGWSCICIMNESI